MKRALLLLLVSILVSGLLGGCSSASYYSQSVIGHSRLMLARQPVDSVIQDAGPELKQQLLLSKHLRAFSVAELKLPDNRSYQNYVALERDYPVWTVVAAEEFSLDAKSWCYPVIGCAAYRGYFDLANAQRYAASLNEKGFETHIGGAIAYSTLGWFADPLLPSMMRGGEAALAENMFHELAHQVLYVKDDSAFNEAFASVVGEQGALRWLRANAPQSLVNYEQSIDRLNQFYDLLTKHKQRLLLVYSSSETDAQKRLLKQQALARLRRDYVELKQLYWAGDTRYDGWFERSINNARLAAVSTYREQMPELRRLLKSCDDDFERFYKVLQRDHKSASSCDEV